MIVYQCIDYEEIFIRAEYKKKILHLRKAGILTINIQSSLCAFKIVCTFFVAKLLLLFIYFFQFARHDCLLSNQESEVRAFAQ